MSANERPLRLPHLVTTSHAGLCHISITDAPLGQHGSRYTAEFPLSETAPLTQQPHRVTTVAYHLRTADAFDGQGAAMSASTVILGMLEDAQADTQLEQRITDACTRLSLCTSRDEAWPHWCEFCRLIESRSAEAVARLERSRGLRK